MIELFSPSERSFSVFQPYSCWKTEKQAVFQVFQNALKNWKTQLHQQLAGKAIALFFSFSSGAGKQTAWKTEIGLFWGVNWR